MVGAGWIDWNKPDEGWGHHCARQDKRSGLELISTFTQGRDHWQTSHGLGGVISGHLPPAHPFYEKAIGSKLHNPLGPKVRGQGEKRYARFTFCILKQNILLPFLF